LKSSLSGESIRGVRQGLAAGEYMKLNFCSGGANPAASGFEESPVITSFQAGAGVEDLFLFRDFDRRFDRERLLRLFFLLLRGMATLLLR